MKSIKCEECGKEIPDVILVHKGKLVIDSLSNLAVAYHLFCSEECQRLKKAQDEKGKHPYG